MDSHLLDKSHAMHKRKNLKDKILLCLFMAIYLPIEIIVSLTLGPIIMPFLKTTEQD